METKLFIVFVVAVWLLTSRVLVRASTSKSATRPAKSQPVSKSLPSVYSRCLDCLGYSLCS